MALLSECQGGCGKMVSHRVMNIPLCDDCSGKNEAIRKEKEKWDSLTLEQKVEELKIITTELQKPKWSIHDPIG